jgi:hypothetical protein
MAAVAPLGIGLVVRDLDVALRPGVSMQRATESEHNRREFVHYCDPDFYRPQEGRSGQRAARGA